MIKFFRNFRKKIIDEDRFRKSIRKYLFYAIGEIILVVIGILIALQINNLNQKRINSLTESKYLINLEKEMLSNDELNQSMVIGRMDRKIEGLLLAKKYVEKAIVVGDTLTFLNKVCYGGVSSGGHTFGSRNYYNELLSTGNLQLIKNDSLKQLIADYYARLDIYRGRSQVHASRYSSYTSELRPFDPDNPDYISPYDQIEMLNAFKSSEFRKIVDLELSYAYKIKQYIRAVKERGDIAISMIRKEIKKKS